MKFTKIFFLGLCLNSINAPLSGAASLRQAVVDTSDVNPISTPFTANGSGSDGILKTVPATAADGSALAATTTAITNLITTINRKGASLAIADLAPYVDPDYLNDGLNATQWETDMVNRSHGAQLSLTGIQVNSMGSGTADVSFLISATRNGVTTNARLKEVFKQTGGSWLISGTGTIAKVSASTEAGYLPSGVNSPGYAYTRSLRLEVADPQSTVQSVTVSGPGLIGNHPVPMVCDNGKLNGLPSCENAFGDHTQRDFQTDASFWPAAGAQYTFTLTTSGGSVQYTSTITDSYGFDTSGNPVLADYPTMSGDISTNPSNLSRIMGGTTVSGSVYLPIWTDGEQEPPHFRYEGAGGRNNPLRNLKVSGTWDGGVAVPGQLNRFSITIPPAILTSSHPCTVGSGTCYTITFQGRTGDIEGGWFGQDARTIDGSSSTLSGVEIRNFSNPPRSGAASLPAPKISATPASVNLGSVVLGASSTPHAVTVKNTGLSDLIINSVTPSGTDSADFSQTNNCGTIRPGDSCVVNVTFTPILPYAKKTALLAITSNDPKKPLLKVKLSGQLPPPAIAATPASLNFGKLPAGTASSSKSVTVTNNGLSDLVIGSIGTSGTNRGDFTATGSCGTVHKGETCSVTVVFAPLVANVIRRARLDIPSNDPKKPTISLKLSGSSSQGNGGILLDTVNPLPNATVGQAYAQTVVQTITPPSTYTYSIDTLANGNGVPSGMTLNMAGLLSGTPFATGATDVNGYQIPHLYTFGVCATDTVSRAETTPCPQTSITVLPLNLAVTLAGTGTGTVTPSPAGNSCGANCYSGFASGSSVTLTAAPATGSTFTGWSGACSGTGDCVVKMDANKAVTATFTQAPAIDLTGTWVGTWHWTGQQWNGCPQVNDGGSITLTITHNGDYYSGSSVVTGIQDQSAYDCSSLGTSAGSGSISGGISGTTIGVGLLLTSSSKYSSLQFAGTGTLSGTTWTSTLWVNSPGENGSFTVTKQ